MSNPKLYDSIYYAGTAKSLQLHTTVCDPIDSSLPDSPVPGFLQARTLEWVAISFSNARKWKVKVKSLSRVRFLATPRNAAYQAPLSMGFSRQGYWSGLPCPPPGHLPNPGTGPMSLMSPALAGGFFTKLLNQSLSRALNFIFFPKARNYFFSQLCILA